MPKTYRRKSKYPPKTRTPATAAAAAGFVRAYVLKLFLRDDGKAVDWPLIAETLLLEAFHALDQQPHSPRVRILLKRVEDGVYARMSAIESDPYIDTGPLPEAPLSEFEGPQPHFSDRPAG
jgi:hypothetical protein